MGEPDGPALTAAPSTDEDRALALAMARLREGTEVLRTGGGTTLTAEQCNALLDFIGDLKDDVEALLVR